MLHEKIKSVAGPKARRRREDNAVDYREKE